MASMQSNTWGNGSKPFVLLLLLILFGILLSFRLIFSPEARIRRVMSKTKYKDLTPLVVALSKVETGRYTSRLFTDHKNLFGMKNAGKREQPGREILGSDFRYYDSLDDSVRDLVSWMEYTQVSPYELSPYRFIEQLKERGYFEEPIEQYFKLFKSVM